MIDSIKVKNLSTNQLIKFSKTPGEPYMLETDGIDWGSVVAKHNTYTNLSGIGNTITSTKIDSRSVSITGRVCPTHTNKQLMKLYSTGNVAKLTEYKLREIAQSKQLLSQLVNPSDVLRIHAGDYYIEGKPTTSVKFSSDWKENNEIYCKFTFTIDCEESPLFHFKAQTKTQLSGITGGFHFPLVLRKNKGIHFGIKRSYQLLLIDNNSDTPIGGVFYLKAKGPVTHPTVTNVYGQQSMTIEKDLVVGEILKIDTTERKIWGSTDRGETFQNYFSYWNFDNSWIEFVVGNTLIGFSTVDESYKNLDLYIELDKQFYSIGDQ